jgi:nucleotide-binding universal stress UspA family protein
MYKRILVAVDGSETSGMALEEAIKLARVMDSTLLLLHVCEEAPVMWEPDGMGVIPMQDINQAFAAAGRALLKKDKARVAAQGLEAEKKLVEVYGGHIGAVISEEAQRWLADLIVVGTHGRKGLEHWLMGSVAEAVARTASMPVLLVRSPG